MASYPGAPYLSGQPIPGPPPGYPPGHYRSASNHRSRLSDPAGEYQSHYTHQPQPQYPQQYTDPRHQPSPFAQQMAPSPQYRPIPPSAHFRSSSYPHHQQYIPVPVPPPPQQAPNMQAGWGSAPGAMGGPFQQQGNYAFGEPYGGGSGHHRPGVDDRRLSHQSHHSHHSHHSHVSGRSSRSQSRSDRGYDSVYDSAEEEERRQRERRRRRKRREAERRSGRRHSEDYRPTIGGTVMSLFGSMKEALGGGGGNH